MQDVYHQPYVLSCLSARSGHSSGLRGAVLEGLGDQQHHSCLSVTVDDLWATASSSVPLRGSLEGSGKVS